MVTIPDDFVFHLLHQLTCAAKETGWGSLLHDADMLRSYLPQSSQTDSSTPEPQVPPDTSCRASEETS
jgi:hypothetical protein